MRSTLPLLLLVFFCLSVWAEPRLWLPGSPEPDAACRTLDLMTANGPSPSAILIADTGSLVGKTKVAPDSREFLYEKQRISLLTSEDLFPQLRWEDLGVAALENRGGLGNAGVGEGTLRGKKVLIKANDPTNRNPASMMNEARWYLLLNKLGHGPEFYGLTRTPEGNLAIVMEFVDGVHFPAGRKGKDTPTFPILDSHIDDVLRVGRDLKAIGADYTPDMQFRLTPEGRAVLIDPEFFQYTKPRVAVLDLPWDPKANTEAIARDLRALQKQQKAFGVAVAPKKPEVPAGRILIPGENDREERPSIQLILPK